MRVEVLSRFLSAKEQTEVVQGVQRRHRRHRHRHAPAALATTCAFKDLGLLVVDEEQRFGVQHKERIKEMRTNVDVLTLTATPIPRTLEMSLTGIRDLSLVNTPPEDRQPILTYVGEYDERAVSEAIRRELLREGQVLYVHNRVQDIEHVAADVRELVPEARVAVAHGQMDESRLERVVQEFWEHEYDVLVCTTIVESGLDMPTVNTLVVDRADLLGLAQLYQLRGRVGRRGQRAYAYLLYPRDHELSEEAYERLKTIGEFTDLGSGFKIAMRDLEIRGAGNLLGAEQSGHIAAVGFDLYVEMVTEAVGELTGDAAASSRPRCRSTCRSPRTCPRDYIARDDVRMEAYRRLAAVTTPADVDDVRAEWNDRYGPPPPPAAALLDVARLRAECLRLGIRAVSVQKGRARFDGWELRKSQEARLQAACRPRAQVLPDAVVVPVTATARAVARRRRCSGCSTRDRSAPKRRRYHPPDETSASRPPRRASPLRRRARSAQRLLEHARRRRDDQRTTTERRRTRSHVTRDDFWTSCGELVENKPFATLAEAATSFDVGSDRRPRPTARSRAIWLVAAHPPDRRSTRCSRRVTSRSRRRSTRRGRRPTSVQRLPDAPTIFPAFAEVAAGRR